MDNLKYMAVERGSLHSLQEDVNYRMGTGWIPQGGVSVHIQRELQGHDAAGSQIFIDMPIYVQAMIKGGK